MDNDLPTTGDINLDHAVKQWLQFDKVTQCSFFRLAQTGYPLEQAVKCFDGLVTYAQFTLQDRDVEFRRIANR